MPETVTQRLDITDATGRKISVSLTDAGDVIAGGEGSDGDLVLRGGDNQARVRVRANGQTQLGGGGMHGELSLIRANDANADSTQGAIHLKATGQITAGGRYGGGLLTLKGGVEGKTRISLSAGGGEVRVGGNGRAGFLQIYRMSGEHGERDDAVIDLDGQFGKLTVGCQGTAGALDLRDAEANQRVRLSANDAELVLYDERLKPRVHLSGASGDLRLGGNGSDADLALFDDGGDNRTPDRAAIRLQARTGAIRVKGSLRYLDGTLRLGSGGQDGTLLLRNGGGDETVRLDGGGGEVRVRESLHYMDGALRLGSGGLNGTLIVRNYAGVETVRVDGGAGDIILNNADCAEEFDLADGEEWVPGAVMVFDEGGSLRLCGREYDTAVAGVVSGAGHYRPGIVLDRRADAGPRVPLAMLGKVFCLVDADFGAVRPGALLTTSPRRGHAMRASDPARAFGAVIGKALKPLESGRALVPVMVSLQ